MKTDGDDMVTKPEPSLCDFCQNAGKIQGGSVGIGTVSGEYKNYLQRYCSEKHISIHMSAYNQCDKFKQFSNKARLNLASSPINKEK